MGDCLSVDDSSTITSKSQQTLLHKQKDSLVLISGYIRYSHINTFSISLSKQQAVRIQRIILMFYNKNPSIFNQLPIKSIDIQSVNSQSSEQSKEKEYSKLLSPKTPRTPKIKKKPTQQELQLVLDHFNIAINKNIEQLLHDNERRVLQFRDKIYSEAKQNQINCQSDDKTRLEILGKVVEYAYMNIEPPNEYTKQTDRKHFKEVAVLAAKFCQNQNIKVPITLICAAWCHDIERFIPATKCKYLPESVDKYRKQAIHPITSARIAHVLYKDGPLTSEEMDRIYQLILRHDLPNPRTDTIIMNKMLIQKADDDLLWELECLMDGDAFAFFESTISIFIQFKSESNSPDWIWERVRNNVKKLRQDLRPRAAECVNNLSKDLLGKMRVNWDELNSLCFLSGSE